MEKGLWLNLQVMWRPLPNQGVIFEKKSVSTLKYFLRLPTSSDGWFVVRILFRILNGTFYHPLLWVSMTQTRLNNKILYVWPILYAITSLYNTIPMLNSFKHAGITNGQDLIFKFVCWSFIWFIFVALETNTIVHTKSWIS